LRAFTDSNLAILSILTFIPLLRTWPT
jgi:hypothetical protein